MGERKEMKSKLGMDDVGGWRKGRMSGGEEDKEGNGGRKEEGGGRGKQFKGIGGWG